AGMGTSRIAGEGGRARKSRRDLPRDAQERRPRHGERELLIACRPSRRQENGAGGTNAARSPFWRSPSGGQLVAAFRECGDEGAGAGGAAVFGAMECPGGERRRRPAR